ALAYSTPVAVQTTGTTANRIAAVQLLASSLGQRGDGVQRLVQFMCDAGDGLMRHLEGQRPLHLFPMLPHQRFGVLARRRVAHRDMDGAAPLVFNGRRNAVDGQWRPIAATDLDLSNGIHPSRLEGTPYPPSQQWVRPRAGQGPDISEAVNFSVLRHD
ncbi:MAG: hypothetical protein NFW15_03015, partial [Candidatus Accumulibacter sp.]